MSKKARVVLIAMLVLPVFVYLIFVYGLKDVFFETLPYVKVEVLEEGRPTGDSTAYIVPAFAFTDQNGDRVTQENLRGNIYVASFFFASCPTVCPAMNFHLQQIADRFKGFDDFYILSHTVDPQRDSVEALKLYAQNNNFDRPNWFFVTGARNDLYAAAKNYYLSAYEDELAPGGFLHSQSVVLVDWQGRIRSRKDDYGNLLGAYDVLDVTQLNDLEEDIKVLKAEYERYKHNLEK
jgi:protein SCO1/2